MANIIDIHNMNIQKLTLAHLVNDAKARNDDEAVKWLREQAMTEVEYIGKDGSVKKKFQSVNAYRMEYLTKFCGYVKKEAVKLTAEQKRQRMLDKLFNDDPADTQ